MNRKAFTEKKGIFFLPAMLQTIPHNYACLFIYLNAISDVTGRTPGLEME